MREWKDPVISLVNPGRKQKLGTLDSEWDKLTQGKQHIRRVPEN